MLITPMAAKTALVLKDNAGVAMDPALLGPGGPAILEVFFPGQEDGHIVADLLFGGERAGDSDRPVERCALDADHGNRRDVSSNVAGSGRGGCGAAAGVCRHADQKEEYKPDFHDIAIFRPDRLARQGCNSRHDNVLHGASRLGVGRIEDVDAGFEDPGLNEIGGHVI